MRRTWTGHERRRRTTAAVSVRRRHVVNRIEKTHTFTRKDRRLRSAAAATTVVLANLMVAAAISAVIAGREPKKAVDQQRLGSSRQPLAQAQLVRNQGKTRSPAR